MYVQVLNSLISVHMCVLAHISVCPRGEGAGGGKGEGVWVGVRIRLLAHDTVGFADGETQTCSVSEESTGAQQETWRCLSSENSFHSVLFSFYFLLLYH